MTEGNLLVCIENALPPIVRASGELDQASCNAFESVLRRAFEGGQETVVLALDELVFIDSCGIQLLIKTAVDAGKSGRNLKIASMPPHLDRILTLSGFRDLFGATTSVEEAAQAARSAGPQDRCFSVPRMPDVCRQVRNEVAEFAQNMGFDRLGIDDIRLAVGEAVSNAVRHGSVSEDCIQVKCRNISRAIEITLRYPSATFDPDAVPAPTYASAPEGGMGIYFMKLVMDRVAYEFQDGYTTLTLRKKLD